MQLFRKLVQRIKDYIFKDVPFAFDGEQTLYTLKTLESKAAKEWEIDEASVSWVEEESTGRDLAHQI